MRTNIDIDDDLMHEALAVTGLPTKRSVVEEALRRLIMLKRQQDVRSLRGRLRWEGDLDDMRRDT
jgi:Arc/MetJ family transcription regulator